MPWRRRILQSGGRRNVSWLIVSVVALAAVTAIMDSASAAALRLVVLDREVGLRVPPVTLHGNTLYLWASDVAESLGAQAISPQGDPQTMDILRAGQTVLTLREQDPTAQSPDGPVRLDYAPYVSPEGRFMVPAREVWEALGAYTWLAQEKNTLYVCSQLNQATVTLEDQRFILHLDCSLPVNCRVYALASPPRLVVDLPATKLKANPASFSVASQGIARVRVSQFSQEPFATRVVADLIGEQQHDILSPPGANKIAIRIGGQFSHWPLPPLPRITSVSFSQTSSDEAEIHVSGDRPLNQFTTFMLKDPLRLVVDIPEVIMESPGGSIQTENPALPVVRFSQFRVAPFIARVAVVLDEPRPFFFDPKGSLVIRFSLRSGRGIVIIDPGHGGDDSGAVGARGTQEKDVNLDVALRLVKLLIDEEMKPILTRSADTYVSLDERCDLANALNADIFVSLHCNASVSRNSARGLETYYFHPRSEELAATVHRNVVARLNYRDRGVRVARFVVVRKTAMPAILVEIGYLNHSEDEALLRSPEFRQRMAEALKEGICEYMRTHALGRWSEGSPGTGG